MPPGRMIRALLTTVVRQVAVPLLVAGDLGPLQRALRASGEAVVAADPWLSVVAALVAYASRGHPGGSCRGAARPPPLAGRVLPPALAVLRAAGEELGALPLATDGADPAAVLGTDEVVPAEPAWEALVELARCAGRLRRGDDPLLVRRAAEGARREARHAGFDLLYLQGTAIAANGRRCLRGPPRGAGDRGRGRRPRVRARLADIALGAGVHGHARLRDAPDGSARGCRAARRGRPHPCREGRFPGCGSRWPRSRVRRWPTEGTERPRSPPCGVPGPRSAIRPRAGSRSRWRRTAEFESAIRLGQYAAARTAQCWLGERLGETAESLLMKARSEMAAGRNHHARATLRRVLDAWVPAVLPSTPVDALLQEAALAVYADDRFAARRALQSAVELAEPLELVRPFVHAGPEVRELLAQRYGSLEVADTFGGRALAAGARRAGGLESVLSRCELAVLAMLSSLQSLEEIAADLTVSVNTVKSHVRSIYSKLGVSSRRSAVLAAHEQGLVLCVGADGSGELPGARPPRRRDSRHPRGSSSTGEGCRATDADAGFQT